MAYKNTNKLLTVQLEESGKLINRAEAITLVNSEPQFPSGAGDAYRDSLTLLEATQHVLIQRAGVEFVENNFDLGTRFDLLNTAGDRIFFAGERLQDSGGVRSAFDVRVLSSTGSEVLRVVSKGGRTAVSKSDGEPLGFIVYRGKSCCCCSRGSTQYSVQDPSSCEIYVLTRVSGRAGDNGDGPGEFEILDASDRYLMGRLSRNWIGEIPAHSSWFNAYGVSFMGSQLNVGTKGLLVGALCAVLGVSGFTAALGAFMQKNF